jgi:hypothetical protein
MKGISAVAGHFQENWTFTPISWEYFNLKTSEILTNDPDVPIIAAPFVELLSAKSMTIPVEQTTKRCSYAFHCVFSIAEGIGMFDYWNALSEFQKLYENRTIGADNLVIAFEEVTSSISSVRDGRNLQQATVLFSTYENLDLEKI